MNGLGNYSWTTCCRCCLCRLGFHRWPECCVALVGYKVLHALQDSLLCSWTDWLKIPAAATWSILSRKYADGMRIMIDFDHMCFRFPLQTTHTGGYPILDCTSISVANEIPELLGITAVVRGIFVRGNSNYIGKQHIVHYRHG
jgi:hypothetical protein